LNFPVAVSIELIDPVFSTRISKRRGAVPGSPPHFRLMILPDLELIFAGTGRERSVAETFVLDLHQIGSVDGLAGGN
jgi:hypothetical protein